MNKEGALALRDKAVQSPPSPLEVRDMALYLGVDLAKEAYLVDVAKAATNAPLPPEWEEFEGDDGDLRYYHAGSGVEVPTHPLDGYFLEMCRKLRAKKALEGRRGPSVDRWYRFRDYPSIPERGPPPYPWADFVDMTSRRVYYFNFQTNAVSWEHPGPMVKQQLREAAAAYLQGLFRGWRFRRERRREAATWRVDAAEDAVRRAREAERAAAAPRGARVKEPSARQKARAAALIQRLYRGHLGRREARRRRAGRAAVRVQCWWRGVLARRRWLGAGPGLERALAPALPPPRYPLATVPAHRHPASEDRLRALVAGALAPALDYLSAQAAAAAVPRPASNMPLLVPSERAPFLVQPIGSSWVAPRKAPVPLQGERTVDPVAPRKQRSLRQAAAVDVSGAAEPGAPLEPPARDPAAGPGGPPGGAPPRPRAEGDRPRRPRRAGGEDGGASPAGAGEVDPTGLPAPVDGAEREGGARQSLEAPPALGPEPDDAPGAASPRAPSTDGPGRPGAVEGQEVGGGQEGGGGPEGSGGPEGGGGDEGVGVTVSDLAEVGAWASQKAAGDRGASAAQPSRRLMQVESVTPPPRTPEPEAELTETSLLAGPGNLSGRGLVKPTWAESDGESDDDLAPHGLADPDAVLQEDAAVVVTGPMGQDEIEAEAQKLLDAHWQEHGQA